MCHGCFDLMHPGHIQHFQAAKEMGDILVVTVTPDKFVNKGPGRPVFTAGLRAASVAALECVDFAAINKWSSPVETIKLLRPDIYVKGQEYETDPRRMKELVKDLAAVKAAGAKMAFTHEKVYSSTKLINTYYKKFMKFSNKIKTMKEMAGILRALKKAGKKTVLSYGVFDIIHPGIIKHLRLAKGQGDVLVVCVIKNEDVRRGPERPIFDETLRLENAASMEFSDYVCLVGDREPYECVKKLKPDIFMKGESLAKRDQKTMRLLKREERGLEAAGCEICRTENVDSSTSIINQLLDLYSEPTKKYLKKIKKKYGAAHIIAQLKSLKKMKVLVIGDGIIDEYHYCESMGRSSKEPLVVERFLSKEAFAGGAFAAANHIAGLCGEVELLSVLGDRDTRREFLTKHLAANIRPSFFTRADSETIIKKRFLEQYTGKKLFEICHMDKGYISRKEEAVILKHLVSRVRGYDMVLALDFGHGLFTKNIIDLLGKKARFLALNVQTNSANSGFNMITKYRKADFGCLTEMEARLACHDEYGGMEDVMKRVSRQIKAGSVMLTRGNQGTMGYGSGRGGGFEYSPALASRIVDRVGAGDALFSFAAPCAARKMPLDLVSFVGNAAGALAVQIVCNREPVDVNRLFCFIRSLLV